MKLYLIRHGETDWNKEFKIQGSSDIELNEYGRELAFITREGLRHIPFDIAYTSPLKRAKETAEIILGGRNIPLYEDERVQEACFGSFEGATLKELRERQDPEVFVPSWRLLCLTLCIAYRHTRASASA